MDDTRVSGALRGRRAPRASQCGVLIFDADPLARRAIRAAVASLPEVDGVAESGDWRSAVAQVVSAAPALVVMELAPRSPDPIDPLRRLLAVWPETPVVVFSVLAGPEVELGALRTGARGFVAKEAGIAALVPALRAVLKGEVAISRCLTMELIRALRTMPDGGRGLRPVRSRLTNREWEVLDLVGAEHSTREIAELLVLTEDTVYSHVKNAMRKLGVHTRSEAVALMDAELGVG